MPNALTFAAVYDYGIKDPHFVLGPKIPEANEYHQIILDERAECISGKDDARGGLPGDQGADRRPERRLSRRAVGGAGMATSTLQRWHGITGRGRHSCCPRTARYTAREGARTIDYAPAEPQSRAVAALLSLSDAAGDRRAGRDLALPVLLARLHEPAQCRARAGARTCSSGSRTSRAFRPRRQVPGRLAAAAQVQRLVHDARDRARRRCWR